MTSIAIDIMGGDHAPAATVEGAVRALDALSDDLKLILVGDQEQIEGELNRLGHQEHERLEIRHADEVIAMDDPASAPIRKKTGSSISLAAEEVKQGKAQALVSAGHTGAAVAATVYKLRTLPGILRPGIATVFPTPKSVFLLIDAGANVGCKPAHLVQYGIMGEIYMREILGIEAPRIGLLNVGDEVGKGNDLTKETYHLLAELKDTNFVGNVEGSDLFADKAEVIVCDGFVGNVLLKSCESLATAFGHFLKGLLEKNNIRKFGALLSHGAFRDFKKLSDYSEYGGAPLLGLNGVCIIGHGGSSAIAVQNAVRVAAEAVAYHLNDHIVERIDELEITAADINLKTNAG